jgi:hypothetical protein
MMWPMAMEGGIIHDSSESETDSMCTISGVMGH